MDTDELRFRKTSTSPETSCTESEYSFLDDGQSGSSKENNSLSPIILKDCNNKNNLFINKNVELNANSDCGDVVSETNILPIPTETLEPSNIDIQNANAEQPIVELKFEKSKF